tara:strand:+ start:602 stop:910 length:309 start_codon:yes stop_codon:yes gene_type:complete
MSKSKKITKKELEKIATLSKLSLSESELKNHTKDLNNILEYMDLLNEIDTSNTEELVNVHDATSDLREDNSEDSIPKEKVIDNSPQSKEDYIEIPLVVKKDN